MAPPTYICTLLKPYSHTVTVKVPHNHTVIVIGPYSISVTVFAFSFIFIFVFVATYPHSDCLWATYPHCDCLWTTYPYIDCLWATYLHRDYLQATDRQTWGNILIIIRLEYKHSGTELDWFQCKHDTGFHGCMDDKAVSLIPFRAYGHFKAVGILWMDSYPKHQIVTAFWRVSLKSCSFLQVPASILISPGMSAVQAGCNSGQLPGTD